MISERRVPLNPALVFASAVLLSGCWTAAGLTGVSAELGEPFELWAGHSVTLDDGGLTLLFEDVPEDSRCPVDVVCVWEGNAAVALAATTGDVQQDIRLNTSSSPAVGPRSATVDGYVVELLELAPAPVSDRPIPGWNYRATLQVSRVSATTAAGAAP